MRARRYYSLEDGGDGLKEDWTSPRLFMNPPFSKPKPWCLRLADAWETREVDAGVTIIGDRAMSTEGGYAILRATSLVVVPKKRVAFIDLFGQQIRNPNFGVVLVAGGWALDPFAADAFEEFGTIWAPTRVLRGRP